MSAIREERLEPGSDTRFGCLFCATGAEEKLIRILSQRNPEVEFLSPKKKRWYRHDGTATEQTVALFPGYLFFRAPVDFPAFQRLRYENVHRLLVDADRDWHLAGSDAKMAEKLFAEEGIIGFSKAYYEKDRIRILDGFLKDYEGSILRVNHRMQTAEVRTEFAGRTVSIWLGFELIEKKD